jgi:hypothetical protein
MPLVTSGVEYGHLRQLAMQRVKDLGTAFGVTIVVLLWKLCFGTCLGHICKVLTKEQGSAAAM